MNRYIAALAIGIGLMAHSPAFAEILTFRKSIGAPIQECIEASEKGYELSKDVDTFEGKQVTTKYLVRGLKMGLPWRVYTMTYFYANPNEFDVMCSYRTGEKF